MKKAEENVCPKCGSDDITILGTEYDDSIINYASVCDNCKCEFTQVYTEIYIGCSYYDKTGTKLTNLEV